MDNAEFDAPKPQAMSDAELELALEQAKSSSDGLLAAMILLEQQEQLRRADEEAHQVWLASRATSEALSEPESEPVFEPESAPASALEPEPIAELAPEHTPEPEPVAVTPVIPLEPEPATVTPVFSPEPTLDENAEFEQLLAQSVEDATSEISQVESLEQLENQSATSEMPVEEQNDDIPPLSSGDLAVTGTLNQIVQGVNREFASAASEELTAEQESSQPSNDEPLPSASVKIVKPGRSGSKAGLVGRLEQLPFSEWFAAVAGTVVALAAGISPATVLLALGVSAVLQASIAFMYRLQQSRSSQSHSVTMRATFGVWGAHLPQSVLVLARVVVVGGLALWLPAALDGTTTLGTFSLAAPTGVPAVTMATVFSALVAGVACILLIPVLRSAAAILGVVLVLAASAMSLASAATLDLGVLDIGGALGLGVCLALVVSMAARNQEDSGAPMAGPLRELAAILTVRVIPALVLSLLGLLALSNADSLEALSTINPVAELNRVSPASVATLMNISAVVVVLSLVANQVSAIRESLLAFNIRSGKTALWLGIALGLLAPLVHSLLVPQLGPGWPLVTLSLIAATYTPYLTEAILRRAAFHEVSLLRSYAFYKKFNILALIGYVAIVTLSLGCTPGGPGFIAVATPTWFGPFTIVVVVVIGIKIWTLATSFARVRRQESELRQVEVRKNELAGLDFLG
jgi:hypothetical protein